MASLLLSRACHAAPIFRVSALKQISGKQVFRSFADQSPRDALRTARTARRRTLKEQIMAPATDKCEI